MDIEYFKKRFDSKIQQESKDFDVKDYDLHEDPFKISEIVKLMAQGESVNGIERHFQEVFDDDGANDDNTNDEALEKPYLYFDDPLIMSQYIKDKLHEEPTPEPKNNPEPEPTPDPNPEPNPDPNPDPSPDPKK